MDGHCSVVLPCTVCIESGGNDAHLKYLVRSASLSIISVTDHFSGRLYFLQMLLGFTSLDNAQTIAIAFGECSRNLVVPLSTYLVRCCSALFCSTPAHVRIALLGRWPWDFCIRRYPAIIKWHSTCSLCHINRIMSFVNYRPLSVPPVFGAEEFYKSIDTEFIAMNVEAAYSLVPVC